MRENKTVKRIDINKLKAEIEKTVWSDIESGKVGGASLCVMQDGETVYSNCFSSDIIKVNEKTLFRLASMTKPITAVAVMKLCERGLLSLDEPVSKIIPEFEEMYIGKAENGRIKCVSKAQTPITLRHVLTHTSGIGSGPVGDILMKELPSDKRKDLEFMMNYFTQNPIDFEPASAQLYSGTFAFDVAARAIELVSGKRYDEFLKAEIFDPLGMKDTAFVPSEEQWSRMIPMHNMLDAKSVIAHEFDRRIFADFPESYFCAGAGLFASLSDYVRFSSMLQNGGALDGVRILSKQSVDEIATPHVSADIMAGNERWGLSVRVITEKSYATLPVGTYGWSGAYGSHFWIDPVNRITAIYMKNSLYDGGAGSVTSRQFEKNVFDSLGE